MLLFLQANKANKASNVVVVVGGGVKGSEGRGREAVRGGVVYP